MKLTFQTNKIMYLTYEQVKKLVFRTGNRPVKMSHVKELINKKELIKNGKWDMHEAVLVNILTNVILNGQHRVTAYLWAIENGIISKDTLLKVDYDEVPIEEELDVIRKVNGGKNWNNDTIVESKAAEGDHNYVQLVKFCDEHELCHKGKSNRSYRAAVAMMTGKRVDFEKDNFTFSQKLADRGNKVHNELVSILNILKMSRGDAGVEGMATAWFYYRSDHPWAEWKKMFKSSKRSINNRRTAGKEEWKGYFGEVSGKINHKSKEMAMEEEF